MRRYLLVIVTLCSVWCASAQNPDSLNAVLSDESVHDTVYIHTALHLGTYLLEYTEKSPLPVLQEALKKAENITDRRSSDIHQAEVLALMGYYYDLYGDLDKAIGLYYKSLEIAEKYNEKKLIAENLSNLAYVFDLQGKYKQAIAIYRKSLRVKEDLNDPRSVAITLNNMAYSFKELADYDSALYYFDQSLSILEKVNDEENMAAAINNIALVLEKQGKLTAAEHYFLRSLELEKKFNKPVSIALSYINIATNYHKQGRITEARKYFDIVDSIATQSKVPELTMPAYNNQAKFYATIEDYKKAYENQIRFMAVKDSVLNEQSSKQIAEMREKYESAQKERQISELEQQQEVANLQLENQTQFLVATLVTVILLVAILMIVIFALRQKRKSHTILEKKNAEIAEANEELNQQNEEIAAQRDEIEKQKDVLELRNKEIADSINVAERIQRAFFKSEDDEKQSLPPHFVIFRPKDVVSGDFYWSHLSKDGDTDILYLSVVDCTGHGVPGAFMSMLGLSFINEILMADPLIMPSALLHDLQRKVVGELGQRGESDMREGMDMSVIRLNMTTRELQFSGANNPLYYTDNGVLNEIKGTKQTIGYVEQMTHYQNHTLQINEGEMIYLFSDGYADQFGGPKGKKIGYRKLRELLSLHGQSPVDEQKENLEHFLHNWMTHEEQIDDITLLGLRIP